MSILVAITGASGVIYGVRLLEVLKDKNIKTYCVISKSAEKILRHEIGDFDLKIPHYREDEITAPFSSGSFKLNAMAVVPCSMKTLAAMAHGYASNLITRSADVMLKEKKKLIIVPRETPLNAIHLENMLKLANMGAIILPAMPAFYHKPEKIEDLVDFIVGKILDSLGVENELYKRWGHEG